MMSERLLKLLDSLKATGGPDLDILADQKDARFQEYSKGWSDIDRQVPAAIILPNTEKQVQTTVQWAVRSSTPFVPKSGGHSTWSTIGGHGVVIDLRKLSGIDIDVAGQKATLKGGILTKRVSVALAEAGLFTALGSGNTVGAIPFMLNGGISPATSLVGYGSDQIVAARIVDAQGQLVDVTEEHEAELLYAIRGAGQFFGLVTQLTVRAYPLSLLGNDRGTLWNGSFVFPMDRAAEVGPAIEKLVNDGKYSTSGMAMLVCPPPQRHPVILIGARCIRSPDEEADLAFKALTNLNPIVKEGSHTPVQNINDRFDFLEFKGQHKRYTTVGLRRFDLQAWLQTVEVWEKMVAACPDAINTSFNFQWDSRPAKKPGFDSAMSLHDIRFWQNNLLWYTDGANHAIVHKFNDESVAIMRGADRSEYVDYQNAIRDGPIDLRFRPASKLEALRKLKTKWDPTGVFTKQLLS